MFLAVPRMLWTLRTNEIHNHRLCAAIYFGDLCLIGLDVDSEVARVETGESDCICCVCQCDGKLKFSGEVTHGVHGSTWRVWFSDYLRKSVLRKKPANRSNNSICIQTEASQDGIRLVMRNELCGNSQRLNGHSR